MADPLFDPNDPDNPEHNTPEYIAYCEQLLAEADPADLLHEDYPGQRITGPDSPDPVKVCSWCPDAKAKTEEATANGLLITHGICENCAAKVLTS